jgi:hypothetical protein
MCTRLVPHIYLIINSCKVEESFLDKKYILISRRYQLHPASVTTQCPSGKKDAHSQLKQKKK